MQHKTALLWWWLGVLHKKRYDALVQQFGGLDEALGQISPQMLREIGLKDETIRSTLIRIGEFNVEEYQASMEKKGVQLLTIEDENYPAMLREIGDPPVFLSYIGNLSILDQPLLSIVGTRRMTPYGRRVVETFAPVFARYGVVTVSGLALGVDAAVAKDTINAGGRTVAVLGHGLATINPKANINLAENILKHGGLLVAEYPLDMQPDVYTFPARNRIIAGLSLGTLVIEAPEDSGSIITADLALEYNRDVFAVPGQIFDIHMAGTHRLIAQGHAKLVTSPEEILKDLGMIIDPASEVIYFTPRPGEESVVYAALTGMPQTMDDLVQKTQITAAQIGVSLTMLELAGAVKNIGGGQWVKK